MTTKNGFVIFECDKDEKGNEILNSTQRNNQIIWPAPHEKPRTQYKTSWKNTCNVTSYVMALEYAGFKFPSGPYKQPEDNLALYILTSKLVDDKYKKSCPAMYKTYMKALEGNCSEKELDDVYPPIELHDYLCYGANLWIGTTAAKFSQNIDFKKALWKFMVKDNLPIVVSTTFGGFGHIVCVTGVQYKEADYLAHKDDKEIPSITPDSIIVDDPWGKYNPKTNKYDATTGGNDIVIPWDVVVARVKPAGSQTQKWAHTFNHGMATV